HLPEYGIFPGNRYWHVLNEEWFLSRMG
ncbi:hypothetical protein AZZ89_002893, partial [Enterobacter hormaechei]